MAVAVVDSGTLATNGSEQTLTTQTAPRGYILALDLHDLVAGDVVIVRIKEKTLSGSTSRELYRADYVNAQGPANVQSVPIVITHEIICTIEMTTGSASIDWELRGL